METMNIAIPPSLKEFVQARVAKNGYSSVSEYVRELIRADQKHIAKALLEEEILKGIHSGESLPMTEADWQDIRDELRRRHQSKKKTG